VVQTRLGFAIAWNAAEIALEAKKIQSKNRRQSWSECGEVLFYFKERSRTLATSSANTIDISP